MGGDERKVCAVRYADESDGINAGVDITSPSGQRTSARTHTVSGT